jgi:transcriptional regulator with XRE-family HTH domain
VSELATTIRTMRKRLGLNLVTFAAQIGSSSSALSRFEAGKFTPPGKVLIKLLEIAQGEERRGILAALHGESSNAREAEARLNTAIQAARADLDKRWGELSRDPERRRMFFEACLAIGQKEELPETIYGIIFGWIRHHDDPEIRKLYDDFFREVSRRSELKDLIHRMS